MVQNTNKFASGNKNMFWFLKPQKKTPCVITVSGNFSGTFSPRKTGNISHRRLDLPTTQNRGIWFT